MSSNPPISESGVETPALASADPARAPVEPTAGPAGEGLVRPEDPTWVGRAREAVDRAGASKVGLGAAVGIGSAALLAAFLYARSDRRGQRS